jgi:hypothetical protein
MKESDMVSNPNVAYQIGRYFAVVERANMLTTKKELPFDFAMYICACPRQYVMKLAKRMDELNCRDFVIKETVLEIWDKINEIPARFGPQEQAQYVAGRYHQQANF